MLFAQALSLTLHLSKGICGVLFFCHVEKWGIVDVTEVGVIDQIKRLMDTHLGDCY